MLPQTWERVVHVTRTHRFQGCTELVVQSTMKTNCQTPPNTIAALAGHRPPQETARGCWRGGPSGPPPTPDKEATSQGWSALLLRVISGGGHKGHDPTQRVQELPCTLGPGSALPLSQMPGTAVGFFEKVVCSRLTASSQPTWTQAVGTVPR
jgi:hypothetical protein